MTIRQSRRPGLPSTLVVLALLSTSCSKVSAPGGPPNPSSAPTADDARTFLTAVNASLLKLGIAASQAGWVAQNYITDDTEASVTGYSGPGRRVREVREGGGRFDKVELPPDQRRQLDLLKVVAGAGTPSDPKEAEELTSSPRGCAAPTGRGKLVPDPAKPDVCHNIDDVTRVMATSRNEPELRREWEGWHTISPPMKNDYVRFVELSNKGARELGFADTGAMWRAKYDMPPDEFTKELDRLWAQVRPLYLELHAYVRMKLHQKYGDVVPGSGPIPAHLLGNIWAQDWSNIYPLVAPANADAGFSLTDILKRASRCPAGYGPDRRAVLHVARFRAAAADVLGRARCSSGRAIARWCATPAPGTSTPKPTCASRCASSRPRRISHHPPRAGAQLLPARLQGPAGHLPRQRQRRLPRGDRRHHRAVGHARVSGADRLARQGARCLARHRPADARGAREDRVPAVRPADRSVAVEGVLGRDQAGRLQHRRGGRCG